MHWLAQTQTQTQEQQPSREVLRAILEGSDYRVSHYLPLLLVGVIGVALPLAIRWWRRRGSADAATRMFRQLASDLSLRWREQLLLIRIARQQALPSPLTLLLSPRTVAHHARQYSQRFPRPRQAKLLQRIARLRRRVFPSAI